LLICSTVIIYIIIQEFIYILRDKDPSCDNASNTSLLDIRLNPRCRAILCSAAYSPAFPAACLDFNILGLGINS
jgi:hypothetical protein